VKVAITGAAGGVGSSLAYALVMRPEPFDIVLIDRGLERVTSHAMDLELLLDGHGSVAAGSCPDVADCDVLVVCAAAGHTRGVDTASRGSRACCSRASTGWTASRPACR
jgi:malate/lactate dehydrogenase